MPKRTQKRPAEKNGDFDDQVGSCFDASEQYDITLAQVYNLRLHESVLSLQN